MKHTKDYHFFASSASTWVTTTPARSLPEIIKMMQDEGMTFNLYLVPAPHDADYEIKMYAPQVEGAEWLGCFEPEEN
jgi:hypothetical protein